ncbi:MAG TPA: transposase [Candidatus Tumulicola sp.]|nr:transposase [Candidatus Tumulicola sp.]
MPRRARLRLAGIPLHVVQRGNNRLPCFLAPDDYPYFLDHLMLFADRFGCAVHAYALMTNHVHLLVTPGADGGVSTMMKHLSQRYVQHVNRVHGRTGTLWEGRYKSCFVLDETYVLTCYRYIDLNPVRAGLVRHPADYEWTSYRANAEGSCSRSLVPHDAYLGLGRSRDDRLRAYRALVAAEPEDESLQRIRDATTGNVSVGTPATLTAIQNRIGRRVTRGKPGRPRRRAAAPATTT